LTIADAAGRSRDGQAGGRTLLLVLWAHVPVFASLANLPRSDGFMAAGIAAAVVLSGSAYMYQQNRSMEMARERAEDAKLLQEVTAMAAMDSGAESTEPLQGLFE